MELLTRDLRLVYTSGRYLESPGDGSSHVEGVAFPDAFDVHDLEEAGE